MEAIISIIVQLVAGAIGGGAVGQVAKNLNMGTTVNLVVGAIGGIAGTWLAAMIPGLDGLVGAAATVSADGTAAVAGGLDIAALVGQGVTGLVGGGILTAIAGLVKNMMGNNS